MQISYRALVNQDVPSALALWAEAEGVVLRGADAPEAIARYLARNPGLSRVAHDVAHDGAHDGDRLVGAVLCGHDGRRGFLHHLAVAASHRRRGIGAELVGQCIDLLRREGIAKCHLMVHHENASGRAFWSKLGWVARRDIELMSRNLGDDPNG